MSEDVKVKRVKYSGSPKEGSFFYQAKRLLIAPIVKKARITRDFRSLSVSEKRIYKAYIDFVMEFLPRDKGLHNWFLESGLESEKDDCINGAWLRLQYQIEGKKFVKKENSPDSQGECEKSPDDEDEEEEFEGEEEEEENIGKQYDDFFEQYPDDKSLELDHKLNKYIYRVLQNKAKAEAKDLMKQTSFRPEFKLQENKQADIDDKEQNPQTAEVALDEQTSETVPSDDDNEKIEKKYAAIDSIEDENKWGGRQWDGDETHCHKSAEAEVLDAELSQVISDIIENVIDRIVEQDSTATIRKEFYQRDARYANDATWRRETLANSRLNEEGGHAVVFVLYLPWIGWVLPREYKCVDYGFEAAAAYINCKIRNGNFDPEDTSGKSTVEGRFKRISGFLRRIFEERKDDLDAQDTDVLHVLLELLRDRFMERKPEVAWRKKSDLCL